MRLLVYSPLLQLGCVATPSRPWFLQTRHTLSSFLSLSPSLSLPSRRTWNASIDAWVTLDASFVRVGRTNKSTMVMSPRMASVERTRPMCFRVDRRRAKGDEEAEDAWEEDMEGKEEGTRALSRFMVTPPLCVQERMARRGQSAQCRPLMALAIRATIPLCLTSWAWRECWAIHQQQQAVLIHGNTKGEVEVQRTRLPPTTPRMGTPVAGTHSVMHNVVGDGGRL